MTDSIDHGIPDEDTVPTTQPHLALGSVVERRAFVNLMETAARLTSELDRQARASAGISLAQLDILLNVVESGANGVRMTDLAELLVVSRSGTTYRVDQLEKRGLLRRDPSPDDLRTIMVSLTPKGLTLARAAVPAQRDLMRALMFDHLDEDDLTTLSGLLDRICAPLRPPAVVHRGDLR